MQKSHERGETEALPLNSSIETLVMRDLKVAYGLTFQTDIVAKFTNLKIFVMELNDLRGSDRQSFPQIIQDLTSALCNLRNLECVELT